MPCPKPSMGLSGVGSFPVSSGSSLTNFPIPLGDIKLALNKQNFLHMLGVCSLRILAFWEGIWMGICLSIWSDIHISICASICLVTFVWPSLCLSIHCYIHTSVGTCIHLHLCYIWAIVSFLPCQIIQRLTGYLGIPLL